MRRASRRASTLSAAALLGLSTTHAGTVRVQQWQNADCSGPPAADNLGEQVISSATCLPGGTIDGGLPEPSVAYTKTQCSDDGRTIALPRFADPECLEPTDMNDWWTAKVAREQQVPVSIVSTFVQFTYPEGMVFTSGECVHTLHLGGALTNSPAIDKLLGIEGADQSWKITADDCHGDEVSRFETHLLLGILLTTCLLCACAVSCCRQMRKGQGGGAGMPLVAHAQPVDAVVVEASFVAAPT